jgi:carboxymethylenebutenolidase
MFAKDGVRPAPLTQERLVELTGFVNEMPMGTAFDPQKRAEALASRDAAFRARIEESLGAIMGGMNLAAYVPQLLATTKFLRTDFAPTRGKGIGSVGFCMGGGLSALLASHDPDLKGAIIFYGSPPPDDRVEHIRCPMMGFYGSKDARVMGTLPVFVEKMKSAGKRFESHVYEGAEHAFFNDARPVFNVDATRDSFARTCTFFASVLA